MQLFEDLQNLSSAISKKEEEENPAKDLVGKCIKMNFSETDYAYIKVKKVNLKTDEIIGDSFTINTQYNEYLVNKDEEYYLHNAYKVISDKEFNDALNKFTLQVKSIFESED